MNDKYLQTIRSKLQENYQLVERATWDAFQSELRLFFQFLENTYMVKSILDELRTVSVDVGAWQALVNKERSFRLPDGYDYKQRAALCLAILEKIKNDRNQYAVTQMFSLISSSSRVADHVNSFITNVLRPFYSYIDSRIDVGNLPLYLIRRFKHRTEWFQAEPLIDEYKKDTKHGEARLDMHLRKFLFDQGIDYPFSTPLSSSGRVDICANLDKDDYFIIEVKIFDAKTYEKGYVRKGFVQAVKYTEDYNKDMGFLVIFNVSDKRIEFNFKEEGWVRANNKTVFFVVINLKNPPLPASRQKKLDSYVISEDYLKEGLN
jgi:hypothetical protein